MQGYINLKGYKEFAAENIRAHSALMFANFTTLPHFSVSLARRPTK
jgi:hypothetical protein